ncbi:MAG: TrkA C-terminal domain-containing protein, partial [Bacteroidales bacterium]|nr:TrkA C-terminal domain-containing protein [Bacteroidales bacterium]
DQLDKFKREFETTRKENSSVDIDDIVAVKFVVDDNNRYAGRSIRETPIYRDRSGLVIRILRNGTTINSPVSDTKFEKGDIVWLVGDRSKINRYI